MRGIKKVRPTGGQTVFVVIFGTAVLLVAVMRSSPEAGAVGPVVPPEVLGQAPISQQAVLDDALVTKSEYQRAMADEIRCLRDATGLDVKDASWDPTGRFLRYTYVVQGSAAKNDAVIRAEEWCSQRFRSLVEMVWAEQTLPSSEARAQLGRQLSTCLADAGTAGFVRDTLPSPSAWGQLDSREVTTTQAACLDRFADFFAAPRR